MTPSSGGGERWVRTADALSAVRTHDLAADRVLADLSVQGALLLNLDIGAGKSALIDRIIEMQRREGSYDLVIYLVSEHAVLRERPCVREWMQLPPDARAEHEVAVLLGRPSNQCGHLDKPWRSYERAGCSSLARQRLCEGGCSAREECGWPDQLTKAVLQGKRVVCATQAYLSVVPDFVSLVERLVGATRTLVILDEAPLLETPSKTPLKLRTVERWVEVFDAVMATFDERSEGDEGVSAWRELHRRLLDPRDTLADLDAPPAMSSRLSERLQELGLAQHPRGFQYLGRELALLARRPHWRASDGDGVVYLRRPSFHGAHLLVAAAGVPLDVARRHLGVPHLQEYMPGVRFLCEGSEVYNLRSRLGAARNFERNAPQIVFTFAQLIAQRAAGGLRCLVVVKKQFLATTAERLERDLRRITGKPFRVIVNPDREHCEDPLVVPIIHYGVRGVNTYEAFDTAIALTSYNARADVLGELINDPHDPGAEVRVEMVTRNAERTACTPAYWSQIQGYSELARQYQQLIEAVWAEQTLGRVRFTVRPRMVFFFQMGVVRFPAKEFTSLAQVQEHFGLASDRDWSTSQRRGEVAAQTEAGNTAREIAVRLGVSVRTVRRHRQSQG